MIVKYYRRKQLATAARVINALMRAGAARYEAALRPAACTRALRRAERRSPVAAGSSCAMRARRGGTAAAGGTVSKSRAGAGPAWRQPRWEETQGLRPRSKPARGALVENFLP